jgi:hypothetical protein
MTQPRYAPKYFARERQKHEAAKQRARHLGEKYYALARRCFDVSDYPNATRLCAFGLKLSVGPFMLAVRDQLTDLSTSCDEMLASSMDLETGETCAITGHGVSPGAPTVHL